MRAHASSTPRDESRGMPSDRAISQHQHHQQPTPALSGSKLAATVKERLPSVVPVATALASSRATPPCGDKRDCGPGLIETCLCASAVAWLGPLAWPHLSGCGGARQQRRRRQRDCFALDGRLRACELFCEALGVRSGAGLELNRYSADRDGHGLADQEALDFD